MSRALLSLAGFQVAIIGRFWVAAEAVHAVVFGYRRCLSKRFPFAIYYSVDGELIRVHAVLDCRRNPTWIRSRLT